MTLRQQCRPLCELSTAQPAYSLVHGVVTKQCDNVPVEALANGWWDEVKGLQGVVAEASGQVLVEALIQDVPEDDVVDIDTKTIKEATSREEAAITEAKAVKGERACSSRHQRQTQQQLGGTGMLQHVVTVVMIMTLIVLEVWATFVSMTLRYCCSLCLQQGT